MDTKDLQGLIIAARLIVATFLGCLEEIINELP